MPQSHWMEMKIRFIPRKDNYLRFNQKEREKKGLLVLLIESSKVYMTAMLNTIYFLIYPFKYVTQSNDTNK